MNKGTFLSALLALTASISLHAAMAADRSLVMAYSENAPPVSWTENGIARGIFIDVVEEIVHKRLGIPVEHKVLPWARAQQIVKDGKADGLLTVANTKRRSSMNVSETPVQTHHNRIVVNSNHPQLKQIEAINSLELLKPYQVGVQLGNGWAKEHLAHLQVAEAPSIEHLLKMLVAKRIDLVIQGDAVTLYYRKALGYTDRLTVLPHSFARLDFNFMVNKNSHYAILPERFDAELNKLIRSGELEKIFDRYR